MTVVERQKLARSVEEMRSPGGIILWPCEILAQTSIPLVEFDDAVLYLANLMREHRARNNGVGIAACQVGLPVRMFVYLSGDEERVVVNPRIAELDGEQIHREGCLSLPGARVQVKRATTLLLTGRTIEDEPYSHAIRDPWTAAIVQHEMEHLEGRLIIHAEGVTRQMRKRALAEAGVVE